MTEAKPNVVIYTDGACSPNPGAGGWGAILIASDHGDTKQELSGAEPDTTNNRMELTAAVEALGSLKRSCKVDLFTDSQYLKKAFTDGWLAKWQRNGWKTSARKPVLNKDLWQRLVEQAETHDVTWKWVRGHNENPNNERCDELAVMARQRLAGW